MFRTNPYSGPEAAARYHQRARKAEKELEELRKEKGVDILIEKHNQEVDALKAKLAKAEETTSSLRMKLKESDAEKQKLQVELQAAIKNAKDSAKRIESHKVAHQKLLETLTQKDEEIKQLQNALAESQKSIQNLQTQLDALNGELQKKTAQANRDYHNSSKPSSMDPNHPKIINNSRTKTGKKPGAQEGHAHAGRRILPTNREDVIVKPPEEVLNDTTGRYRLTDRTVVKQLQDIAIGTTVFNYVAPVYYDTVTKRDIHGEFPTIVQNEVTYGDGLRALALSLTMYANVAARKVQEIVSNLTNGQIVPSVGWINELSENFSILTQEQRNRQFADMLHAHVMHTDATNVRINGHQYYVYVCACETSVLFFFREHKGKAGIKGTPVEATTAILIHDHDIAFYDYGSGHQECLAHVCRYLKDSIMNEPDLTWNVSMLEFTRRMLDEAKKNDRNFTEERIAELEAEYHELIELGKKEYEDRNGPGKYYRDGFNLLIRMDKYANEHMLFLRDPEVDSNNNLSESLLRSVKRKVHQVTTFRSFESVIAYCEILGYTLTVKREGKNPFEEMKRLYSPLFADSVDGMTNREYRELMNYRKRELERLSYIANRNREKEKRVNLTEAPAKQAAGAWKKAGQAKKAAETVMKKAEDAARAATENSRQARDMIYNSKNKQSLIEQIDQQMTVAMECLEKVTAHSEKIQAAQATAAEAKETICSLREAGKKEIAQKQQLVILTKKALHKPENNTGETSPGEEHQTRAQINALRAENELKDAEQWLEPITSKDMQITAVLNQFDTLKAEMQGLLKKCEAVIHSVDTARADAINGSRKRGKTA